MNLTLPTTNDSFAMAFNATESPLDGAESTTFFTRNFSDSRCGRMDQHYMHVS